MPTFDVIDATLTEEFGGTVSLWDEIKPVPQDPISNPKRESRLNFRVKLAEDERVMLSSGEHLNKLVGLVTLSPRIEDFEDGHMGIGVMSYSDPVTEESIPACYYIKVLLPQAQFDDMLYAARLGRIPSCIVVKERGMALLDEFSKKWDEKTSPHLHVASISFSIPLAERDTN